MKPRMEDSFLGSADALAAKGLLSRLVHGRLRNLK
jgi:hypothetical protein